jgi:hypothetical protein
VVHGESLLLLTAASLLALGIPKVAVAEAPSEAGLLKMVLEILEEG